MKSNQIVHWNIYNIIIYNILYIILKLPNKIDNSINFVLLHILSYL